MHHNAAIEDVTMHYSLAVMFDVYVFPVKRRENTAVSSKGYEYAQYFGIWKVVD